MTLIFCSAFIAGLVYCAAPGVVNAEGIRRGLYHGFNASLIFQIGALAGDALWAVIAMSGLAMLRPSSEVQLMLGAFGGLFLLWMAWGMVRSAWREQAARALPKRNQDLLVGALIALANPFAVFFWVSLGGGLLAADALTSPLLTAAIVIGAFFLAGLLWSLLIAATATYSRTLLKPAALRWINTAAGVLMAVFGVSLCWQTVTTLTPLFA